MGETEDILQKNRVSNALEDLPADARVKASNIAGLPPGLSLRRKIFDELENAGLESYGQLEQVRLFRFLADYPVAPHTYDMSRGQRPTAEKLTDLVRQGRYRGTLICAPR